MSSPNLNDLIIVGCIMIYVTAILLGVDARLLSDSQLKIMCQVIHNFDDCLIVISKMVVVQSSTILLGWILLVLSRVTTNYSPLL